MKGKGKVHSICCSSFQDDKEQVNQRQRHWASSDNGTTGIFTVPMGEGGVYFFTVYLLMNQVQQGWFVILVNDVSPICKAQDDTPEYVNLVCSGIVKLNEGLFLWHNNQKKTKGLRIFQKDQFDKERTTQMNSNWVQFLPCVEKSIVFWVFFQTSGTQCEIVCFLTQGMRWRWNTPEAQMRPLCMQIMTSTTVPSLGSKSEVRWTQKSAEYLWSNKVCDTNVICICWSITKNLMCMLQPEMNCILQQNWLWRKNN